LIRFDEDLGPVIVVDEGDVACYTLSGYVLKAVVQETEPTLVYPLRQHLNPPSQPGLVGTFIPATDTEYIPKMKARYILALSKDEAVVQAQARFAEFTTEVEKLKAEIAELQDQLKLADKKGVDLNVQLTQALSVSRQFAHEREQKDQVFTTLKTERNALVLELASLRDNSKNVERLMACEDWLTKLIRSQSSLSSTLSEIQRVVGPIPVTSPRTWAERLIEDEDENKYVLKSSVKFDSPVPLALTKENEDDSKESRSQE
jgi:cell division protein FtsB